MPQIQLTELQHVLIKIETTEGTDAVPTGTDAVQILGPATLTWGAEKRNTRESLFNGFLEEATDGIPGGLFGECTLRLWLRGRGAAYSAGVKPEVDAIVQSGAFSSTGAFGAGVENYKYETINTGSKTVTIYGFESLESGVFVKHIITAGRASRLSITADAGGNAILEATIRGIYNAPTDAADVAPTYLTTVPPVFTGASSWSIGATAPVVRSASMTAEQTLVPRFNANATGNGGLAGYALVRRRLTWGAVVEAARVSDYNPHADWVAATAKQILLSCAGGASGGQYNRVKVTADKAVLEEPPVLNDEGGLRTYQIGGKCGTEGTNRMLVTFD